jgi:HPt (histidine-containing phosphotransfer) domain-containing protein
MPPCPTDQPLSPEQQSLIDQVLAESQTSPPSEAPNETTILDLSIYLELFGEITDDVRALLGDFLQGANELEQQIIALHGDDNSEALARAAHRLAGAALTAGALELGTLCRTLEQAIKQDQPSDQIATWVGTVPDALSRVRTAIAAV